MRLVRAKNIADLPVPIRSLKRQFSVGEIHAQILDEIEHAHEFIDEARRLNESACSA